MTADGIAAEVARAHRRAAAKEPPSVIGLETVVLGSAALDSLVAEVERHATSTRIVMLEDATPMLVDAEQLKPLVAGLLAPLGTVDRVVLGPADGALRADDETIGGAVAAAANAGCLVAVGSGTLTDIGKEAARASGVPLVVVQTAASVNGYADGMAVVLKDGVKRTVPSAWPTTLIIDTRVLARAPSVLTRSGFGEMMATFSAPADWRLAAALGFDEFDPEVIGVFRDRAGQLLRSAAGLVTGDADALELLATLLTTSGMAMGVAGKTAPLSGMEHVISHLVDMSAHADGRPVGFHGAQVGVASLVAACLWERLLSTFDPDDLLRPAPPDDQLRQQVNSAFAHLDPHGATAAECWADYRRKLVAWNHLLDRRAHLAASWETVRSDLAALAGEPAAIAKALTEAGAPLRFLQLDPPVSAATARWAVAASPLMRRRFTVADLAFFTGHWSDGDVAAVLERAADVGGGL